MKSLLFMTLLVVASLCYSEGGAEFCVVVNKDPDEYSLHLVKNLNLDPDSNWEFPDAAVCTTDSDGPIWDIEATKKYKETITTGIDYGSGNFTPIEEMLYRSCEDYMFYENVRLPQNIKKEKSLYGKVLPVRINAEIQSDSTHRKDHYDFKIRVNGPCEK